MAFFSSVLNLSARILPPFDPPSFPSATAAGFFTFTGAGNFTTFDSGWTGTVSTAMLRRLGTKALCHKSGRFAKLFQDIICKGIGGPQKLTAKWCTVLWHRISGRYQNVNLGDDVFQSAN